MYSAPAALIVEKILVAVIVKQCLVLKLRVTDQLIIKIVGPQHCKMFIHQMPADTDLHGPHQHLLLILHLHQFRYIGHYSIGSANAVYILICKITEQLYPVTGSVLIFHGDYHFILVFPPFQDRLHLSAKKFPSLSIVLIICIRVVVKQFLIPRFRIANELIIMLIGPYTGKMFIDQMLADADI